MPRAPWIVACLALLAVPASGEGQRVNVVAEQVRGVPTVDAPADTASLLVYVVDDAGDPVDEVQVIVLVAGKQVGAGRSDGRGRALLVLPIAGPVQVRASEAGFVTTSARTVVLRHGGLTAVALPLEEAALLGLAEEPDDEELDAKPAVQGAPAAPALVAPAVRAPATGAAKPAPVAVKTAAPAVP